MGLIDKLPEPEELYRNLPWPELEIVGREEWGALPPTYVEEFESYPIRNVILGYTETEPCDSKESCIKIMQELQKKHMAEGEPDIRFSYVVGLDERVYMGRGFKTKAGTHPRHPNLKGKSVEVVLSGQRGLLPRPGEKSSIMYILVDKSMFEGTISLQETTYTLDYDDYSSAREAAMIKEIAEFNERAKPILAPYAAEYRRKYGDCE